MGQPAASCKAFRCLLRRPPRAGPRCRCKTRIACRHLCGRNLRPSAKDCRLRSLCRAGSRCSSAGLSSCGREKSRRRARRARIRLRDDARRSCWPDPRPSAASPRDQPSCGSCRRAPGGRSAASNDRRCCVRPLGAERNWLLSRAWRRSVRYRSSFGSGRRWVIGNKRS